MDISKTGLFVFTYHRFEPGQKLRFLLDTPLGSLFVEGRVIWVCDENHPAKNSHKQGMGIRLVPTEGAYDPYADYIQML